MTDAHCRVMTDAHCRCAPALTPPACPHALAQPACPHALTQPACPGAHLPFLPAPVRPAYLPARALALPACLPAGTPPHACPRALVHLCASIVCWS